MRLVTKSDVKTSVTTYIQATTYIHATTYTHASGDDMVEVFASSRQEVTVISYAFKLSYYLFL